VTIGEGFVDRLECFSSHKERIFKRGTRGDLFKEFEVIFAFPRDFVVKSDTLKVRVGYDKPDLHNFIS